MTRMKLQALTLGLFGLLTLPVRGALHVTHYACDFVGNAALFLELRLQPAPKPIIFEVPSDWDTTSLRPTEEKAL